MFSKILSLILILTIKDNCMSESGEKYLEDNIPSGESEVSSFIDSEVYESGDISSSVDSEVHESGDTFGSVDSEVPENGVISNDAEIPNNGDITNDDVDLGWELTLVNFNNKIPDGYEITLKNIDASRQFDSRAIGYLNSMVSDARKAGATNLWSQSTYRSVETQKSIYNNKVNQFLKQGKSEEEAKRLTEQTINKPGYSEHNLGLAVDFNYVNYDFENTKAFSWLVENAENYGFILRYKKEKESITNVKYEPWHWRYVGVENAKEMNRLNMCLEEYVEFLKGR